MKKTAQLLAIGALTLGITACGGEEESNKIEVEMTEFAFSPATITVQAGAEVEIEMKNSGTMPHEWVIIKPGRWLESSDQLPETEAEILANWVHWEDELNPGRSKDRKFTAPSEPGEYQIVCVIDDHFEQGMVGTLIVEA